jgi:GntR family transcriptional regulator
MSTGSKRFACVPEQLIISCSPRAVQVYAVLASKWADSDGECWPAVSTIAEVLRVSEGTIRQSIRELVTQGWVVKLDRWQNGQQQTNVYKLKNQPNKTVV